MQHNIFRHKAFIPLLFILPLGTQADICGKQSPNLKKDGDSYYELGEPKKINRAQSKKILALKSAMKGRWQGQSTEIYCKGPERSPTEVTKKKIIKSKITSTSGTEITIPLEITRIKQKSSYNQTLKYLSPKTYYKITNVSDNSITIITKHRQPHSNGSHFVEDLTKVTVSAHTLELESTRYHNGFFALKEIRKLQR